MLNKIIQAVGAEIYKAFGEGYEIYREEAKQDFKKPSFFISSSGERRKPLIGKRFYAIYEVKVEFFPEDGGKEDMDKASQKLSAALEYPVIDGNVIRGSEIKCEAKEESLCASAEYTLVMTETDEPDELMETMKIISEITF